MIFVQEMLGSAHNLFGGVHIVHLRALGDGEFAVDHVLPGQSAGQVMEGTYHCQTDLLKELVSQVTSAVTAGKLSQNEANQLTDNYQRCLNSYTYFSMPLHEKSTAPVNATASNGAMR